MFKTLTLAVSAIALLSLASPASADQIRDESRERAVTEDTAAPAEKSASEAENAVAEETVTEQATTGQAATEGAASAETIAEETAPAPEVAVAGDIVATASSNPDFTKLVEAIAAADLTAALQSTGPFTVFAPTNAAFDALPEGTLDDLLKPENQSKLQDVLKYHVVSGKIGSGDIADGETEVDTVLEGKTLKVVKTAEGVSVNGAKVTAVDVPASNGVIHVIDAVVLAE